LFDLLLVFLKAAGIYENMLDFFGEPWLCILITSSSTSNYFKQFLISTPRWSCSQFHSGCLKILCSCIESELAHSLWQPKLLVSQVNTAVWS
jgi:hypothetical protein